MQEVRPNSPSSLTTNVFGHRSSQTRPVRIGALMGPQLLRAVANADDRGPRAATLFGSHNSASCAKALDVLVDVGLG